MKILVFGDIHGNLISLEKLFLLEKNNFDHFVSHGDVVNYGPWSNECVEFLMEKKNGTLLKGNHEKNYIKGYYSGKNEIANAFFDFCFPNFNQNLIKNLSLFNNQIKIEDFTIRHTINEQYIFEDTDISTLNFHDNTVIGHSHQQFHRIINNRNIYNTGSLGQNRMYINVANYLIIDTKTKSVDLKFFTYDIDKVLNEMEIKKYPIICLNYYKSKNKFNER